MAAIGKARERTGKKVTVEREPGWPGRRRSVKVISAPAAPRTRGSVPTKLKDRTEVPRLAELSLKRPDLWSCDLLLLV